MSSRYVKASENNSISRVIVSSKKKRASQILKAFYKTPSVGPTLATSLPNKTLKRKRNNNNNNNNNNCKSSSNCFSSSSKNLLKNYSKFMKSGPPKRVLFSEDNQWCDFSQDVIDLVKEKFLTKTTSFEVKFNGCHLMLDFLRMNEIDLKSGGRKPIAWIDEKGSCFFPENNNLDSCHESKEIDSEIKLHVEIELNEGNNYEECVEESNVKRVKVDDECVKKIQIDEESVRNMFMKGVSESERLKVEIMEVKKCLGGVMESKLDLFKAQVEITKKLRGNANVEYAWFLNPKGESFSTLGHDGLKLGRYGYGVHLHSTQNRDIISDVDEMEVKCMVLCRVILGNMEVVKVGSKQFYASEESYDSGVDDMENPKHYVVWNMNMNTHIYPEYAVTFKISPSLQAGNLNIEQSKVDLSTKSPLGPLQIDNLGKNEMMQFQIGKESVSLEKVQSVGSSTSRAPNSPWMPFSKLFEAISDQVSPDNMNRIHILYESLRGKKTSREEFIKKLRVIVGDQILRSTISSLQSKT